MTGIEAAEIAGPALTEFDQSLVRRLIAKGEHDD